MLHQLQRLADVLWAVSVITLATIPAEGLLEPLKLLIGEFYGLLFVTHGYAPFFSSSKSLNNGESRSSGYAFAAFSRIEPTSMTIT